MVVFLPYDLKTHSLTMTSMKMWYLLFLAAFLPIVPTVAEVVESVSECDQFLLEAKPPQVPGILEGGKITDQNRYKPICQTLEDERKFLTLYDTKNRIPVFSALKYRGEGEGKTSNEWMIEPQLENEEDKNKNMVDVERDRTYNNQAGDNDYKDQKGFTRGHLIASSYGFQISGKMSTYTLTNIVPQQKTFNKGSWSKMEKCVKCIIDRHCTNNGVTEAYVVTGAQPNNNNKQLNNRVNIPDTLWSAFCCFDSKKKKWIANAHWGNNDPEILSEKKTLPTKTLGELKQQLGIDVFRETQCPETVFFTNVDNCPCPRSASTTSSRHN
ncbi:endonuclease domain-containing 1 protein-like [Micropterus salmoides]|uniref:endonuclease domain-containing 1 protein-like n=1 Tax=Micropterus salmoides TaxID=27706 RepID=UPI0018EE33BF|nr:endonuclease domain-containing 1 protein-like [Micropterus salmoides]